MRLIGLISGVFLFINIGAQEPRDLIITKQDELIRCKITKIAAPNVHYEILKDGQVERKKKNIYNCDSIYVSDDSVIKNPMKVQFIDVPDNQSYVYIFRPNNIVNSAMKCKLYRNGLKVTSLKNNSYYLDKIDPGNYQYYWKKNKEGSVDLNCIGGESYFIRCEQTAGVSVGVGIGTGGIYGGGSMGGVHYELTTEKRVIGELGLKSVKKVSK
jgi:hypothetical protein